SKITSDGTALVPGVADLIDEGTGQAFPFEQLNGIWDPSGRPDFTSDTIYAPFGPAIQIAPLGLSHSTKYTVVVHPALISDRAGPVTTLEKYFDSPPDPATNTCPEALSSTMQIDLYNTTGKPGEPKPWPLGTYKIFFAVNSTDDNTTTFRSSSWPGAEPDGTL